MKSYEYQKRTIIQASREANGVTLDTHDTTMATPGVGDTTTATNGAHADDRVFIRTLLADRQTMQESLNMLIRLVQRTHTADGDPAGRTNPKD